MLLPGAKMVMQEPKLLKLERASVEVEEPTLIALGTNAKVNEHASPLLLPPATVTVTPWLTIASTAASAPAAWPPLPKLMVQTAGSSAFTATQSIEAKASEYERPLSIARIVAEGATPNVLPPAEPAQWDPCPRSSTAQLESPLHSTGGRVSALSVGIALPPKSWCDTRTPESRT